MAVWALEPFGVANILRQILTVKSGGDRDQIQDEIIGEFSLLDGDMEMTVFYIMELGQKLPDMPAADKTDDNVVKGCQSKVWLTARLESDRRLYGMRAGQGRHRDQGEVRPGLPITR